MSDDAGRLEKRRRRNKLHFVGAKHQILLPGRKRYEPTMKHHVGNPQFLQ